MKKTSIVLAAAMLCGAITSAAYATDVGIAILCDDSDVVNVLPGDSFAADIVLDTPTPVLSFQLYLMGEPDYFTAETPQFASGWWSVALPQTGTGLPPVGEIGATAADLAAGNQAGVVVTLTITVDAGTPDGTYTIAPGDPIVGDLGFEECPVTASEALTVVVGSGMQEAPAILGAASLKDHGGVSYPLDVLGSPSVECRQGGPTTLVVDFDGPIAGLAGLDPSDVAVSSGLVTEVTIAGSSLEILLTDVTNGEPLVVSFPGIASAGAGQAVVTDTLCIEVLAGDVNADLMVSAFDLLAVRNNLQQSVGPDNFVVDLNADGTISAFDLLGVRNALGTNVMNCP